MIFDKTLQKTERWLNEIAELMGWRDKQKSYETLRAVLHALRDRLTVESAAKFAAQIPMLVRGIYYEGWVPQETPSSLRIKKSFLI
ncbi:MAG: DUF2267 domain-containing protein [Chlamydiales bacterium]